MPHDFYESDVRFDVVFAERLIEEQISNLAEFRFAIIAVAGKKQKNPYLLGIIVFAQLAYSMLLTTGRRVGVWDGRRTVD